MKPCGPNNQQAEMKRGQETQQHICSSCRQQAHFNVKTDRWHSNAIDEWVTLEGLHGLTKLCVEAEVFSLCAKSCSFIEHWVKLRTEQQQTATGR